MISFRKVLVSTAVLVLLLGLCAGFAYAEDYEDKVGIIAGSVVNLREEPNTSANVLDKLPEGTEVKVLSSSDGWHKVIYNGKTGWVCGDYLSIKEARLGTGTVTAEVLNVRSKPDKSSDAIAKLNKGNRVIAISRSGDWYKIKTSDGTVGWVFHEYLTIGSANSSRSGDYKRSQDSEGAVSGEQIVSYAKKFLGVDYVWGGTSPKGFDCSGFVYYVYKHFGITLERASAEQAKQGTKVSKSNLKVGDLVFFDTNGGKNGINHVGIYIGDGKFIHAESERKGVTITELSESYYSRSYMTARRML